MRLFHYRPGAGEAPVPQLAETATARGWRPAPDQPLGRDVTDSIYEIACDMYGVPRGVLGQDLGRSLRRTKFRDAFCFSDAGRTVTVANARAVLGPEAQFLPGPPKDVAVCAIQLPAVLLPGAVQSRRYRLHLHMPASPTGNPLFDERFQVSGMPSSIGGTWLTPEVQEVVLPHDDWVLLAFGPVLACVSQGAFSSADQVLRRIQDVLQVVAAIPASMLPDHADHSVDDLAARMAGISSVEDALAFLQQLTDDDRDRLAHSDTPLADFADVRTPEEAMTRLQSLPPARQMQLMAMFMR